MAKDEAPPPDWQARLDKQWGPPISRLRRWVAAAFIILSFFGLIALAFLSVSR